MNYSLTQFVKEAQPSPAVIDYIIRTNHHYILIVNQERNARILLNEENYAGITEDNGVYYIHSKKPILINGKSPISTFEVSIENGDDIINELLNAFEIKDNPVHNQKIIYKVID